MLSKKYFSRRQKKAITPTAGYSNNRKSGYYWVLWAVINGREWKRVGYYNEMLQGWLLPGEERIYFDQDIIRVYETLIECPTPFLRRIILWIIHYIKHITK